MPKQKKSSKKRDLNNRKPNAGLAALRKVLQGITPVPGVTPDLSRPASGFLSQVMGSDDEGNVGFTLSNPFLPKEKRKTLGLVDETLSIPTLIELFGIQSPEFATEASERTDFLRNAIREDMGLSEPEGFAENAAESAGVMLGQLPIPSKKKVEVGVGAAKGLRAMLKKILGSGPEFFSPTVDPKLSNYASGAGFGGALGMLGDEPPPEEFAQGGLVPAGTDLESLRRRFQELMQGGGGGMATPTVAPTQAPPPPPGPAIVKFPDELTARRRQRPDAKLSELFNYGAGPEFNNFFVDPTFGTPNPDAPPLRVPFSRPARTPAAPISVPTDRVYTSGSRLTANLNNPIMELRRRLGKADGGMVSDPIDDVLQVAGRNLMGLTRNIRMAKGGKVSQLLNLRKIAQQLTDRGATEQDIGGLQLNEKQAARLRALLAEEQGVKPAKSGLTPEDKKLRKTIQEIKYGMFGESDEPNWDLIEQELQRLNSADLSNSFLAYRKFYDDPTTDIFSEQGEAMNIQLSQAFENALDSLTPGKRIPNPNE